MRKFTTKNLCIAIVAVAAATAAHAAHAQTNIYWGGGPGVWSTTSTNVWYPGVSSNGNGSLLWTPSGSQTTWGASGSSGGTASFGYLSISGSGGDMGFTSIASWGIPSVVTLSSGTALTVNMVAFGSIMTSSLANFDMYQLVGGTLNTSNVVLDVSNSGASSPSLFKGQINSNIVTGGTLNVTVPQISASKFNSAYLYLGGTNQFNTINIPGIPGQTPGGNAAGVVISNTAACPSGTNLVMGNNAIFDSICPNGQNITLGNITMTGGTNGSFLHNSSYGAYSTTSIIHIGAGAFIDTPNSSPTITITGAISGSSDVSFGSGNGNDSRGVIVLSSQSNYTGDTYMQQSGDRFVNDPDGMGVVRLGVNNALPINTNLIFGRFNSAGNGGVFDLNGHSQQVRSIGTMLSGVGSTTNDYYGGISNFSGSSGGTLQMDNYITDPTISNPHFIESQFHGLIGQVILDGTGRSAASNNNVTLVLGTSGQSSNALSLTLGLAGSGAAPPAYPYGQSNTYTGGTYIYGGALFAADGLIYSTTGTQNSATGTGPVLVSGGTLGGSVAGGGVGMPSTGPVTIASGGYLLPGGGYFTTAGSSGLGNGGYSSGTVAVFTPKANLPLNVLGDLNLQSGSIVNFNFDATHFDQVKVGGNLNLSASASSVTVGLAELGAGSIPSGTPIFLLTGGGSITGSVNSLSTTTANTSFVNVGTSEIDLQTTGATLSRWSGNSGTSWDTSTNNFKYLGNSVAYTDGNPVWFEDGAGTTTVNITGVSNSGLVQPASVLFRNQTSSYRITGGTIGGSGAVDVAGGGTVTFSNSGNTYTGGTTVEDRSTLVITNPNQLPAGGTVKLNDAATLQLGYNDSGSGTLGGTIQFLGGALATGAFPAISVAGSNSATFNGIVDIDGTNGIGLTKTGPGTLVLASTTFQLVNGNSSQGATNINQGTVRVTQSALQTTSTSSTYVSSLGLGNMIIGRTGQGGTLWLDNVQLGITRANTISLGFFDGYTGGTLKGTGNAVLAQMGVSYVLNDTAPGLILSGVGTGTLPPAGSFTLSTGTSTTDSLTLQAPVTQFDNNSSLNNGVNYLMAGTQLTGTNAPAYALTGNTAAFGGFNTTAGTAYQATMHVTGAGTVKLQGADAGFGGTWSVDSGILQVGPFNSSTNLTATASTTFYRGPTGQMFNALGYYTPNGQSIRTNAAYQANPNLPSPVVVNNGGVLALGVDQLNANPNNTFNSTYTSGAAGTSFANPNSPYLRDSVSLNNGAAIAATGLEATFFPASVNPTTMALSTSNNSPVIARVGGDFTVASGGTASVLTYDPHGQAVDSSGTLDANDTYYARTVELVGGSQTLANASPGVAAGVVISHSTAWNGTLVVASSGNIGGTFNIKRSGGSVTVALGAQIVVQPFSTVNISDDNSSLLVSSTVTATYGQMLAPTSGPTSLPVLNNVLSAGGNSVALVNDGTFNVNNGIQTLGAISTVSGSGVFNVTGTATATAPSISQGTAAVAVAATLNLTGPGVSAPSLVITNSGNLNVTGGSSHAMGAIGTLTLDASNNQILPTTGTTTVTGNGVALASGYVYQNTLNINNGAKVSLTGQNIVSGTTYISAVSGLNFSGSTSTLDVQQSGILIPSGNTAAVFNLIKQGAGTLVGNYRQWNGTGGITSSTATQSPTTTAVGFRDLGNGQIEIASTVPGDALLTGACDSTDRSYVSGSNLFRTNVGWSQGDFNYDGVVDTHDRAIELSNEGNSLISMAAIVPAGRTPGAPAVPIVIYNQDTGALTLVDTGANSLPNLDSFGVNLLSSSGATQTNVKSDWLDYTGPDSMQWAQPNAGGADTLPAGIYSLGTLPIGLGNAAFGNSTYGGLGNTAGAAQFFNTAGAETDTTVTIVPEPSSLALCGAGLALAAAIARARRSRHAVARIAD